MPQNLASKKNSIIGAVILLVVVGGGYFWYSSSQDGSAPSEISGKVDPTLFNTDVAAFYAAKDKINLKDLSFMKKSLYTQLKDNTVDIPSVKPTGRDNPFVPYAATGPIR